MVTRLSLQAVSVDAAINARKCRAERVQRQGSTIILFRLAMQLGLGYPGAACGLNRHQACMEWRE